MVSAFSASGMYNILHAMQQTQLAQRTTSLRLSTGHRINSGADNPAGLIALKLLESDLGASQAASENISRTNSMLNVADSAMGQISTLVTNIQGLATELANTSGLSDDEKAAKQLEIDSAVASIDRLVNSTTFNGKYLLNGQMGITTAGVDTSKITDVNMTGRSVAQNMTLNVTVVSAAQQGQVSFTGAGLSASQNITLEVRGNTGSVQLNFTGGTSIASMATTINANTDSTGVRASASGGKLYIQSQYYGESEFVGVQTISGSFALDGGVTTDLGKDANVKVNGQTASVNGMNVTFNIGGTSGTLTMSQNFSKTAGSSEAFTVTGGGATFCLSPNAADLINVGISDMGSAHLGNGTLGYLHDITTGGKYAATDHAEQAARIAIAAASQVAQTRGSIGAFQKNTLGSMENYLTKSQTSLSTTIADIDDTDYAVEIANLTRLNTLIQVQTSALAMLGQQQSTGILSLFSSLNR